MILTGMSIIFIGIPLNTAGQKGSVLGLIPAFIDMLKEAFIPSIGEMMMAMISKGWNDCLMRLLGRHIAPIVIPDKRP